jgi:hypothetical protein
MMKSALSPEQRKSLIEELREVLPSLKDGRWKLIVREEIEEQESKLKEKRSGND